MKTSLFLFSTFAVGLLLAGCARNEQTASSGLVQNVARAQAKEASKNLEGLKSSGMEGARLSGGDSQGRPLWSVSASEIRTNGTLEGGSPKQATLFNAKAVLYRAGKPESNIKAVQMTLFSTPKGVRLQMTKGVTGESTGPWTGNRGTIKFAAPRADVDVQQRIIAASGGVTMSQGKTKVVGQTLRAQTSLQKVDVAGKVRANTENGQVEADTAIYDWQKSTLNAKKVVATQKGTRLTGDTLQANTAASRGALTGSVVAKSEQGTANAPRIDFDWGKDSIVADSATFSGPDGSLRAAHLQTDSKLRVASARGLVAEKDGATLRAAFADGFDGLNRLKGRDVSFTRADATLTAPRVDASKQGKGWVLVATGGARGKNASGGVSAAQVTWDESRGRVKASGGVNLQKDGATLSGATLDSDIKFENATLSGNVRGKLVDGSTLASSTLEKRGDRFFASRGATARFNSKGELGVLTLTCSKLEASADGSTATATGGVTVKATTGATVRAPKAIYDRKSNKLTATGGVDFYDPTRDIRQHGDTLVANLTLKEARITNSTGQVGPKLFEGKSLF